VCGKVLSDAAAQLSFTFGAFNSLKSVIIAHQVEVLLLERPTDDHALASKLHFRQTKLNFCGLRANKSMECKEKGQQLDSD
jgi:hypothetical protein